MKLSRRQFLKATGGTAAGLAAAGMVEVGAPRRVAAKVDQDWKIRDTREAVSICPYCAVGCSTIVHAREQTAGKRDWRIINVEGNPDSPINGGTLCPKGAASFQLAVNERRQTQVLYRAPGADKWEVKPLDWAYDQVAERIKRTRDATWQETLTVTDANGQQTQKRVARTTAIATLGGATMDNEWNYIHSKLMRCLGVIYVENQARI